MKMAKHFTYLFKYVLAGLNNKDYVVEGNLIGSRWAAKTKSVLILCCILLVINTLEKYKKHRVRINWIRLEVAFAIEDFEAFLDTLSEMNLYGKVYINRKNRFVKYRNVEIRFIGYESSKNKQVKKLGVKRSANVNLMINIFEEIFEFPQYKDISIIEQAIGGALSTITLKMTNPWDESHWYLNELSMALSTNRMKFNKEIMKEKGYQFYKLSENKFLDWTNHKINEYLSKADHQKLIDVWKTDPELAKIVELGAMGVIEGGIYTRALSKLTGFIPKTYVPYRYGIGCDVGKTGDATTFILMSHNKDMSEWAIHDEYFHSHEMKEFWLSGIKQIYKPKSIIDYANDGIQFASPWAIRTQSKMMFSVDSNSSLDQVIHHNAIMQSRGDLVDAQVCRKVAISIRIDVELMLLHKQSLHINKNKCPNIIRELKSAKYENNAREKLSLKKKPYDIIRIKGNDHCINGMEYFIGTNFFNIRDLNWSTLYMKKMRK